MKALRELLALGDREHIRLILNSSITAATQAQTLSKVGAFLRERTFLQEGAEADFVGMERQDRERMLSELIWRLTCFLDGSQTATLGTNRYKLSKDFSALITEEAEGERCTLVRNE